jgi:hypothetical protein
MHLLYSKKTLKNDLLIKLIYFYLQKLKELFFIFYYAIKLYFFLFDCNLFYLFFSSNNFIKVVT